MKLSSLLDFSNKEQLELEINEYVFKIKEWLDKSELLKKKSKSFKSNAKFDSSKWILFSELNRCHVVLNFDELEKLLVEKKISRLEIDLIKCFLIENLNNDISINTLEVKLETIKGIIKITNNFAQKSIDEASIKDLFNRKSYCVSYAIQYIEYLYSIYKITDLQKQVLNILLSINSNKKINTRVLPSNYEILALDYYLKNYFQNEVDEFAKKYYYPILLWWKITNIIPMRPSEFANKLSRDCIVEEEGKYYIKITRIKNTKESRIGSRNVKIPILNRIRITKEIYDLIENYKQMTAFDEETNTLLSYKAYVIFRNEYYKNDNDHNKGNRLTYSNLLINYFSSDCLYRILDNFYKRVILKKYKDFSIGKKVALGDTRHLAFCSLLLQGLSPIEIAMIGGHITLISQNHYIGHTSFYIDAEIINYFNNDVLIKNTSHRKLKNIIFNKDKEPTLKVQDERKTEDGVGYCVASNLKNNTFCENVPLCIYCSKWWCEPTNENYIKVKNYIENIVILDLEATIRKDEIFLDNLLRQSKSINLNGLEVLDKNYENEIKKSVNIIKSNADRIVFLKKSLLELFSEENSIGDEN